MTHRAFYVGPNGIGVAQEDERYLRVISPCCSGEIHWDMFRESTADLHWRCALCKELIRVSPTGWASIFDIGRKDITVWLAGWFGVNPERVEVSISGS